MTTLEATPLAPEELQREELREGDRRAREIIHRTAAATHSVEEHVARLRGELFALQSGEYVEHVENGTEEENTGEALPVAEALIKLYIEETEASRSTEAKPADVEGIRERVRKGVSGITAKAA
ncbi:MAG: hypothetical protein AAB853_00030 [Patescibacteria group bacterium]